MSKLKSPWKPKTTILIIAFLALMVWMLGKEASADTKVEVGGYAVGVGFQHYQGEHLILNERWNEGKYQIGVLLQLRLDCVADVCKRPSSKSSNQAIFIQRIVHYEKLELLFGMSYWHNESPAWNSHTPYVLGLGYNFTDKLSLNWKHFSTGGASSNNGGLDFLTVGYTF